MHTTFNVAFSPRYRTWFAVSAEVQQGEFRTLAEAEAEATKLNALLVRAG
jgi:hypothetical protein